MRVSSFGGIAGGGSAEAGWSSSEDGRRSDDEGIVSSSEDKAAAGLTGADFRLEFMVTVCSGAASVMKITVRRRQSNFIDT